MRILFVCHGNICRSPMAEYILRAMLHKQGLSDKIEVASAATSTEEIGNNVYPQARQELLRHGIPCPRRAARQMTRRDYDEYDMIIGMDNANMRNMLRICGGDPSGKLSLLLEHANRSGEVDDPWYSDDFSTAWRDISEGCEGLLRELTSQERASLCTQR